MQKEEFFKLTLEGDGISVVKNINGDTARRVLNLLLGTGTSAMSPFISLVTNSSDNSDTVANQAPSPNPQFSKTSISLREFLDDLEVKRNPDRILGIASYLIDIHGAEDFDSDQIKNYFAAAGEKMPANYGRDFRWAVISGWIAENHQNKGRYYITRTGRKALSEKFPKELSKPQPGYKKTKKNI